ncbi:MAG: DUF1816 domain-containing protein [Oculatellaceae cyanobacterium bins.114]|nr:DUF1816 domain-containing protein [Oculatellaceae cyanobacterium bins.114]
MSEIWTNVLNTVGLAWWVEVITETPRCTYYFGPFSSSKEAEASQNGYVEDLEQEGAQGIKVNIKRCKPSSLTIYDEFSEVNGRSAARVLSSPV